MTTDWQRKNAAEYLLLSMVIAVLLCLWCYATAFHAFDDDEFQHTNIAWQISQGKQPYADFFEHHLVLYHEVTAPLFALGEGPALIFVFRALSLIAAGLTLFLLYKSGRRLGASRLGAAAGVWLLGLTPMFVLKMTEARPEVFAMLAFAAAVRIIAGQNKDEERTAEERHQSRLHLCFSWRPVTVGLFAALMTLLSQKYGIVSIALLGAIAVPKRPMNPAKSEESHITGESQAASWRQACRDVMTATAVFAVVLVLYGLWFVVRGIGPEAFEHTVLLNLRWQYSFSPVGYLTEMYLTTGVLTVTGLLGIITRVTTHTRWRSGVVVAILLAGSCALILLLPVPYRQSFLPLLCVLSLGAMIFCTPVLSYVSSHMNKPGITVIIVFLLLGASSLRVLPEHLSADNRDDLERMAAVETFAPKGPIFDGRRLMFWRPHIGRHACMHQGILRMIDQNKYAEEVISGLNEAGLPPVIYDYRVKSMPEEIQAFIQEHYQPTAIEDVYGAAIQHERLIPRRKTQLTIPADGRWRITWEGGNVLLGTEELSNGETLFLEKGKHKFVAEDLVWNLRIERNYGEGS